MDTTGTALSGSVDSDLADDFESAPIALDASLPKDRFLDREASWLAFNRRVLELAEDPAVPLLERVNFLAIFANNLDEFFMVRVAGLKRRLETGIAVPTNIGRNPTDVLTEIHRAAHKLQERHATAFTALVGDDLVNNGILIESIDDLNDADREQTTTLFQDQIFPVLTPLAVDPAHPFPYISGLSLNLAVRVRNPKTDEANFARVKVPHILPRFVQLPDDGSGNLRFIPLEDLIAHHLASMFPGMEILDHHVFRLTRNEDMEIDEDESENLIQALEAGLSRRRFGAPIRLEISEAMDDVTLGLLVRELGIDADEVYRLPGLLGLDALFEISGLRRPELKYPKHVPTTELAFQPSEPNSAPDVMGAMRLGEVLVHHPYESFATSVQAFIEQAANDPNVLAIKQTLYRTSGDSPIVQSLITAAESGKAVLALVELKARFDEQANIKWARKLEKAGVHVVYGLVGLKTHCKLTQVVRREKGGNLAYYSHIGTGNYNPKTSRVYEDLGLFTSSMEVGQELTRLFNELSGYAIEKKFKRLLVAPRYLRSGLLKLIAKETEAALAGDEARIRIKVNSLVDETIIDALYKASRAGVHVDISVRGICSLIPGRPGLSENIRVHSILGRYLEHSRIFSFHNGGKPAVYIGSSDMMHRNLDRRIEVLVKLETPSHVDYVERLLDLHMSDSASTWVLGADGSWNRRTGDKISDVQNEVMRITQSRNRTGVNR
ncbi:polyphosphate kinase [Microbacteriaceae bacterium MWH-Ta3]|nr:polyphosphate kinase [Microbacteriaceae bacterium MWH-Ta3]